MNKNYKLIELIGLCIIVLVLLATRSIPDVVWNSYSFHNSINAMIAGIAILALASIARMFGYMRYNILFIVGVLVLLIGGSVFYFQSSFFSTILPIPMGFWLKVSIYSLPAMCVEGGLLTLFTVFNETRGKIVMRENIMLQIFFLLYAVVTISINFFVIKGYLSTDHQILISRIIVGFVALIAVPVTFKELSFR